MTASIARLKLTQQGNVGGDYLGKHSHGRAYLLLATLVSHQASQDFVSDALLLLREHAIRAPMSEPRQAVLEIVLIAWRSASALYSCHKCACFFLGFDSHDVRDNMKAEESGQTPS